MTNQFWTELNDQQAQNVCGGNFGQDTQGFFDELRKGGTFPPSRANIQIAFVDAEPTVPKNFGVIQSTEAKEAASL